VEQQEAFTLGVERPARFAAGGGVIERLTGPAATAEIKRMYVRPGARRTGVGRAILERLLADARVEGYRFVRLETLRFMVEAHALYRSVGFVDTVVLDRSGTAMSGLANLAYQMELEPEL